MKKEKGRAAAVLLACAALTACGPETVIDETTQAGAEKEFQIVIEGSGEEGETKLQAPEEERLERIEEQSFETELKPLGEVEFVSYRPEGSAGADAVFQIERDGAVLQRLEGVEADNRREGLTFQAVEAAAFPDYNQDGADDIIVICSYLPESGEARPEVRYYAGGEDGRFSYERGLSEEANAAGAATVQEAREFAERGGEETVPAWRQAYIDVIREEEQPVAWEGYELFDLDGDDVPEMAKIGGDEAAGCQIVNYWDGEVRETQLFRLDFSYIEGGNLLCNSDGLMDQYFDSVYRIQEGKLTLIAQGKYGAMDGAIQPGENEPPYHYFWNGNEVTREEYQEEKDRVYDPVRTRKGYPSGYVYTGEEMIAMLSGEETDGLWGRWSLDYQKTEENLKEYDTLQSMFGTGLGSFGAFMKLGKDGDFRYHIGIGTGGEGRWSEEGGTVKAWIEPDMGDGQEELSLSLETDGGKTYLVMDHQGETMYWKKDTVFAENTGKTDGEEKE